MLTINEAWLKWSTEKASQDKEPFIKNCSTCLHKEWVVNYDDEYPICEVGCEDFYVEGPYECSEWEEF